MKSMARPQEFSKALYTFDIAQNDLSYGFQHSSEEQVKASIPDILNTFSEAVQVGNLNHSLNNAHKNTRKKKTSNESSDVLFGVCFSNYTRRGQDISGCITQVQLAVCL